MKLNTARHALRNIILFRFLLEKPVENGYHQTLGQAVSAVLSTDLSRSFHRSSMGNCTPNHTEFVLPLVIITEVVRICKIFSRQRNRNLYTSFLNVGKGRSFPQMRPGNNTEIIIQMALHFSLCFPSPIEWFLHWSL